MTLPCQIVGGDFFDFFEMADGKPAMIIADVSGKGVPAAMMVSTVHGALHAFTEFVDNLDELASRINSLLVKTTPDNKFVTATFLTRNSMSKEITTLSAGHEPIVLIKADGTMTHLSHGGMVLGLFAGIEFETHTLVLNKGDPVSAYILTALSINAIVLASDLGLLVLKNYCASRDGK